MLVGIVPNPYERRSAAHDEPKTEYPDEVLCHGGGKAAHKTERSGTSYKAKLRAAIDRLKTELRETGARMDELTLKMKHVATYRRLKPVYDRYKASKNMEKFLRSYESEIILFEAARGCRRLGTVPLPS